MDKNPLPSKTREEMDAGFDAAAITSAEKAADIILRGTAKKRRRIIVGKDASSVQIISRLFPSTYAKIMRKLRPDMYDIL